MATSSHAKPSSMFNIICEALIILVKNWKPLLIFILSIFILSVLSFFNSLSITPILTELIHNLAFVSKLKPPNPEFYRIINVMLTELREITIIEAVFFVTSFVISTLILTSTICFVCMAYTEKQPTLQELFSRIRKIWKGTLITQIYVNIVSQMSGLLMFLLVGGFALVSVNSVGFLVASFTLAILALLLYLYIGMILSFSVVVAVKEGVYGLAAVVLAAEAMKGRRRQGVLIALLMMLVKCGVFAAYFLVLRHPPFEMQRGVILGIFLALVSVVDFFDLVVVIVFYFDCKQNDGGLMMLNKGGLAYSSLPNESPLIP